MTKNPRVRPAFGPIDGVEVRFGWHLTPPSDRPQVLQSHGRASVLEVPAGKFRGFAAPKSRDRAYNALARELSKRLVLVLKAALREHQAGRQDDLSIYIPDARLLARFEMSQLARGFADLRRLGKSTAISIKLPATGRTIGIAVHNPNDIDERARRALAAEITTIVMASLTRVRPCKGVPTCSRNAWPKVYPKKRGGGGLSATLCPQCEVAANRKRLAARVGRWRASHKTHVTESPSN